MAYSEIVSTPSANIEILRVTTEIPQVFVLPGAAGGISVYADLCERLTAAGLTAAGLNPRGCGASTGELQDLTLEALADDVAAVIRVAGTSPTLLVGHAGGNRIARMVSTCHPDMVKGTVLLAAGGKVPGEPEAFSAMQRAMDPALSRDERTKGAAEALFAPANRLIAARAVRSDTSDVFARAFGRALSVVPVDRWWGGGTAPMLVIQGRQDRLAPVGNGHLLANEYPDRVRVVDIDDAGHALFLEQPERITHEIVEWVRKLWPVGG